MVSLRSRLIASVLILSALGLIVLAAVTYAEQRSFLEGRVNQEVREAAPALSHALDSEGFLPAARREPSPEDSPGGSSGGAPGTFPYGPGAGGPNPNLPPGTYGQRREASGKVLGHVVISYGQNRPPAPEIPGNVPVGSLFTVGSAGASGLRYRAYATRDPEDSGLTVAAVPLGDVDQTLNRLLLVEVLVIVGVLLALGVASFFVVRVGLRPLDRIGVTAGAIAAGDLSRRVDLATPRTEVGRLGLALNAMLERLEWAFVQRQESEERLRRFLADSSHELRTPLAAIRGYAELFRMGATQDAAGIELAMRRIEQESKRMGSLVEDLLTLARLDEEPEGERTPVDLSKLARDAVQDAHATAPDRVIRLDAPEPAVVSGDPRRLTQVLANLLGNALVHTSPGTPIEVSVEADPAGVGDHDHEREGEPVGDGDGVTVTVRDHGPGLPAGPDGQLFERFWRAEGGRERGKGGAGLGLAIVGAIVKAHGGEVSAANAPDGGAVFVVRLSHRQGSDVSLSEPASRPTDV
jgi:two-component system, OmpR family, sensor kinase